MIPLGAPGEGRTLPIAYAPGYLDVVGRTVWFTVRKAFQ